MSAKEIAQLEEDLQLVSGLLIKGLATASTLHLSVPCSFRLGYLLEIFRNKVILLSEYRTIKISSILRSKFPKILDIFLAFASSVWTVEDRALFESCRCREHQWEEVKKFYRERTRDGKEPMPLECIATSIFDMLHSVFESIKPIDESKSGGKHKKRVKWPPSPSDLIPHGESATVSAYVHWSQLTARVEPIHTLYTLSTVLPALLTFADVEENHTLVLTVINLFSQYVRSLRDVRFADMDSLQLMFVNKQFCLFNSTWVFGEFITRAHSPKFLANHTSALSTLYESLSLSIPLVMQLDFTPSATRDLIVLTYTQMGKIISKRLGNTFAPISLHSANVEYLQKIDNVIDIKFATLVRGVLGLRYHLHCAETSCFSTSQDSLAFRRCSACQTTLYCSKQCQLSDWKTHKAVCKTLVKALPLSAAFFIPAVRHGCPELAPKEVQDAFMEKLFRDGLTQDDVERVIEYVTARPFSLSEMLAGHWSF